MSESDKEKDKLSYDLIWAMLEHEPDKMKALLAQGADPLREVYYDVGKQASALAVALDRTFNVRFDQNFNIPERSPGYDSISVYAKDLLRATKVPLPYGLIAKTKKKPKVPGSYYQGTFRISDDEKIQYEHFDDWRHQQPLRDEIRDHSYNLLIAEHGKLAFPKEPPKKKVTAYEWPETSDENKLGNKILAFLDISADEPEIWHRVLTTKELWRSPEDALAYAKYSSLNNTLMYGNELPIPVELNRQLDDNEAVTHLGRYLTESASRNSRLPGAP